MLSVQLRLRRSKLNPPSRKPLHKTPRLPPQCPRDHSLSLSCRRGTADSDDNRSDVTHMKILSLPSTFHRNRDHQTSCPCPPHYWTPQEVRCLLTQNGPDCLLPAEAWAGLLCLPRPNANLAVVTPVSIPLITNTGSILCLIQAETPVRRVVNPQIYPVVSTRQCGPPIIKFLESLMRRGC